MMQKSILQTEDCGDISVDVHTQRGTYCYPFDNYHLPVNPGLLSWCRAGCPTAEGASVVKYCWRGNVSDVLPEQSHDQSKPHLWGLPGTAPPSQPGAVLSLEHEPHFSLVLGSRCLRFPAQMLANTVGRSHEMVVAAVKDM